MRVPRLIFIDCYQVAAERKAARKMHLERLIGDSFNACLRNTFVEAAGNDRKRACTTLAQGWLAYIAAQQVWTAVPFLHYQLERPSLHYELVRPYPRYQLERSWKWRSAFLHGLRLLVESQQMTAGSLAEGRGGR